MVPRAGDFIRVAAIWALYGLFAVSRRYPNRSRGSRHNKTEIGAELVSGLVQPANCQLQ